MSDMMTSEADIRAERVRAMFQQTPVTMMVAVTNASIMTAVLVAVEHDDRAYAWLAVVFVFAVLRLGLWWAYRRALPQPDQSRVWGILGTCGALASGLVWGGGSVLLFPQSETYQLLWAFLIGGMCAGAAAFHSAHLAAVLAYIVPACLPLAVRFATDGSGRSLAAAAMSAVFLASLTVFSLRSSRRFGRTFRLQLDLAQRTHELSATNAKLRMEMAEHRATEATLRHAQKMEAMGQLTGGIAHDFNNLLTAVLGSLELLAKHLPPADQKATRLLDTALQGAKKGSALTQRLLAFGRRQALEPEVVDVPRLVHGMADLLRSSLGAGVRIDAHFPVALAPAHVDANQLELALLNLAVNARDAMPGGGKLMIAAREEEVGPGAAAGLPLGWYVVLSVADTGEGMDEATLTRAMEPFFTTKGVGKGTGLGLSMVHGLAAQSGGQLLLRSRKGAGTVAELWLPRAEIAAIPSVPASKPARASPAGAGTILVVDDDPAVLASTVAMLRELGHATIAVASGEEALPILRAGAKVDLVITDYAMPGMTGIELAEKLQELRPELAVLLATGNAELQRGVASKLKRLLKPFGLEALAQAVEGCLDRQAGMGSKILPFAPR